MASPPFRDQIVRQDVMISPTLTATLSVSLSPSGMTLSFHCPPFESRSVYVWGSERRPEFRGFGQVPLSQEAVTEMLASIFGGPPGPYPGKATLWLERALARGWAAYGKRTDLLKKARSLSRSKKKSSDDYAEACGHWVQAALMELGIVDPADLEIPLT